MTTLRCCTLTGIDEHTDFDALVAFTARRPLVEWGVLYSEGRALEGDTRYPRKEWIQEFADLAQARKIPAALHLCGPAAVSFLREDKNLWALASQFDRVQLNFLADPAPPPPIASPFPSMPTAGGVTAAQVANVLHGFTFSYNHGPVILQNNAQNEAFVREVSRNYACNALFDASGGQGLFPAKWPDAREVHGMKVGYAGGLGPLNIAAQLPLIDAAAAGKTFWVDMESGLRNRLDRFDLALASNVLDSLSEYVLRSALASGQAVLDNHPEFTPKVESLQGIALDWWAGLVCGYRMNVPPKNASRATFMSRASGGHRSFSPSQSVSDMSDAIGDADIGAVKRQGQWFGITEDGQEVKGHARDDAMLRAMIVQALGEDLPANPATHPAFMDRLVGPAAAQEFAPALLRELAKDSPARRPRP